MKTIAIQNDCRNDAPIVTFDATANALLIESSSSDLLGVAVYSTAGQLLAEENAVQAQKTLIIPMSGEAQNAIWLVRVQEEHQETVHRICVLH